MKINRNITVAFILIIIILGFLFYWYEWRPSKIRKECSYTLYGEDGYQRCLRNKGLEK